MATPRRNRRVETPGEDEIKTPPPTVQQTAVDTAPAPKGESFMEQVAEEAQKGNVIHTHRPGQPVVGDRWAGMVLTERGWASVSDDLWE